MNTIRTLLIVICRIVFFIGVTLVGIAFIFDWITGLLGFGPDVGPRAGIILNMKGVLRILILSIPGAALSLIGWWGAKLLGDPWINDGR